MGINQNREHGFGFMIFDKIDAANLRGKVINLICILNYLIAVFFKRQVKRNIFGLLMILLPFRNNFPTDSSYLKAIFKEIFHQMAAYKAARAGNKNFFHG